MRLFYSKSITSNKFLIEGDDHRHCLKVMRKKSGDKIDIIDGTGWLYHCRITSINRKDLEATIVSKEHYAPLPYQLDIAISPLKNTSRYEWFIEKSVEIGISNIYPLDCIRTEKLSFKEERAERIVQSAMKQSYNIYEPKIHSYISISDLNDFTGYDEKYIAYINGLSVPFSKAIGDGNKILIAIGPEGGFKETEANSLIERGFIAVGLGDARLRTETAGVAACQIVKTIKEIQT